MNGSLGSLNRTINVAIVFLCTFSLGARADDANTVSKLDTNFVSMFDGKTLKGWTVMPAKAVKAWSVQDGMMVGVGSKGRSYLVYDKREIADFELKLSYRFAGEGNSGVSIRARKDETGTRGFQSYHADFGHVGIGKQVLGDAPLIKSKHILFEDKK